MQRPRKMRKSEVKKHQLNAIYQAILTKKFPANRVQLDYDENGFLCYKAIEQQNNTLVDNKK